MSVRAGSFRGRRRGITLVEMLVSLGLLLALMLVCVSWLTRIAKRQKQDLDRANWETAAGMVVDQIEREVMQVELIEAASRQRDPRVRVETDVVAIRVLEMGSARTVEYRYDPGANDLRRMIGDSGAGGVPLLGAMRDFRAQVRMPDEDRIVPELHLELWSHDGGVLKRTIPLAIEDVQ